MTANVRFEITPPDARPERRYENTSARESYP